MAPSLKSDLLGRLIPSPLCFLPKYDKKPMTIEVWYVSITRVLLPTYMNSKPFMHMI